MALKPNSCFRQRAGFRLAVRFGSSARRARATAFGDVQRGREQLPGFSVEHCMKRSEKAWRVVAVALAIGVPLAWAVFAATGTNVADATTAGPALALPQSYVAGAVTPPLSPGIYTATPYSLLVFVPGPIDEHLLHTPDVSTFKMPCIELPTRLEIR
jgi:hypothetical protein